MEQRTPTPEPVVEAPAARFEPPPPPSRSPLTSLSWTLRDYAKRVWDNSGEDNVLFLAGGIAFNILLAAVPFVLLIVWGFAAILHKQPAEANRLIVHYLDRVLPSHVESPDAPTHKIIEDHGGSIDFRNAVGGGTIFRIVLPLFPDPPAEPGPHGDDLR